MEILNGVFSTTAGWTSLIARIALGMMILPHGAQKLLGWFGGYGFAGTMKFFTESMNLPWLLALLVIFGEFFGGLMILFGIGTRIGALWVGVILSVAMIMLHLQHGFFMNWFGTQQGEGIEFFILAAGLALILLFEGGGKYSVDLFLNR